MSEEGVWVEGGGGGSGCYNGGVDGGWRLLAAVHGGSAIFR